MACYPYWSMLPRLVNSRISFVASAPIELASVLQPQCAVGFLKCCATLEGGSTEEGNEDGQEEAKKKRGRKVGKLV